MEMILIRCMPSATGLFPSHYFFSTVTQHVLQDLSYVCHVYNCGHDNRSYDLYKTNNVTRVPTIHGATLVSRRENQESTQKISAMAAKTEPAS
jgi:hypothetical protein